MSGVPSSSQSMVLGMSIGGVVISSVGAIAGYSMEKKKPTVKSLIRDFIIGAILVLMLLQILPDSAQTLVDTVRSLPSFSSGLMSGGGGSSSGSSFGDMDIQVGIPKF